MHKKKPFDTVFPQLISIKDFAEGMNASKTSASGTLSLAGGRLMLNDRERQTEGQKLLKQLRDEYGRVQPTMRISEPTEAATTTENHLDPIPVQ
jgi:hypothetical protein